MPVRAFRHILSVWLAVLPMVGSGATSMNVWAIGDSVRIDPVRSLAFEDNPELFPDGIRAGYKQANLVWDGSAHRVSLESCPQRNGRISDRH